MCGEFLTPFHSVNLVKLYPTYHAYINKIDLDFFSSFPIQRAELRATTMKVIIECDKAKIYHFMRYPIKVKFLEDFLRIFD